MTGLRCQVVIVGAGPYGLAAAAHLRSANVDLLVFGKAMESWERHMPAGMFLRSYWEGSHISDPRGDLTLDRYQRARGVQLPRPVRRDDFIDYGQWFQRQAVPDLDGRRVTRIEAAPKCFRVMLEDGESVWAPRVVIATGIASFAWRPRQFNAVPPTLASHSSEHRDFGRFAGRRVAVVGGGQSALESAALLHESGAAVEVIVRTPEVHPTDTIPTVRHRPTRAELDRRYTRPVQAATLRGSLPNRTACDPAGWRWLVTAPDEWGKNHDRSRHHLC